MNASPEKRSKTNEYLKKYREINASPEKRLKTNEYQRDYRQGHKTSMEFAINRFHEIVTKDRFMFARLVINYGINIVYAVPISSGSQNLKLLNIY